MSGDMWNSSMELYPAKGLDEYKSDEDLAQVPLFVNYPDELLYFAAACCFIFLIIGVVGNIITIIALSKYKKVRNATAFFIINLSVSDLLFSIAIYPVSMSLFINKSWTTGRLMCQIFPAIKYSLLTTSAFTIMAITINRYIMVSHPLLYPKLYQKKNIIIMIIALWAGGVGVVTPMLFEIWGRFSLDQSKGSCGVVPDRNGNTSKIILIAFIFPSLSIIVCYSRILYLVKRSSKKCQPNSKCSINHNPNETSTSNDSNNFEDVDTNVEMSKFKRNKFTFRLRQRRVSTHPTKRDQRLQSMIIAIIVSFFGGHLPIIVLKTANRESAVGPYGSILVYIFVYLMVCFNPIIYVVMSKEFRQAYRSVLCKWKK